ncbi:hypothetical protein D3C78_1821720 [compost metagenome]
MHAALGNHFTIEVRELLEEPHVLEQHGAARPGGLNILVIDYRRTRGSSKTDFLVHWGSPYQLIAMKRNTETRRVIL